MACLAPSQHDTDQINTDAAAGLCCCDTAALQVIAVSLHDATEPQPLALPRYAGEIYVYVALVLGGVWMFSTAPLIIMMGVMVVSEDNTSLVQDAQALMFGRTKPVHIRAARAMDVLHWT